ncbi:rCG32158 [Rattus norvegicus]|uniref:RCG32158 n=1 Tax=Rattus norvegicus TaxID=10116 RepID=A6JXQ9_RAT|nr:rCG32158 [Rattus norvegicus]
MIITEKHCSIPLPAAKASLNLGKQTIPRELNVSYCLSQGSIRTPHPGVFNAFPLENCLL